MTVPAAVQSRHLRAVAERAGLTPHAFDPPEDRELLVGGIRLHYLDWGSPGGSTPTLLLLHGGGLNAHTWDAVCLVLRDVGHCLALDQRGHGDSEWSPSADYSQAAHATDVEGFLDALGVQAPIVIGMSLGGLNAIEVAARRSERLAALVLVDVGPEMRRVGTERIRNFMASESVMPSVDHFVEAAMQFNPRRDPAMLRVSLQHNLRQLPDGQWTWKYDRRLADAASQRRHYEGIRALAERLPAISCPTLVLRGAESDVFAPEDAELVAAGIPGARWETVPNAGHTIQGDNPAGLLAALMPFISSAAG